MNDSVIRVENLTRVFAAPSGDVHALRGVSFEVPRGKITAIVGRSGAGKTTLLNLMGGIDTPTGGTVHVEGRDLFALSEAERAAFRRERVGYVFQSFGLLPLLTAAENVSVPLRMQRMTSREREQRVSEALEWVGLRPRAKHRPYELSGGEQQRVALARALAAQPHLILADEPTGQLDSHTGLRVLHIMRRLVVEKGITMVIVTHDSLVRDEADVVHRLEDGYFMDAVPQ
jgi:putative ABC transport system ATP-binding protein